MRLVSVYDIAPEFANALLYDLMKERPAYANISHKVLPSFDEHCEYVRGKPYRAWYVIEAGDGNRVGAVSLTHKNEVGIAILKDYQRKGYARRAIEELLRLYPEKPLLANVAPANYSSQLLFLNLGGSLIQLTYEVKA